MYLVVGQNPLTSCVRCCFCRSISNASVWFHDGPFPKEESSRLSTGALIRQEELVGERLKYTRLSGTGPSTGWVSLKVKDRPTLGQKSTASFARGGSWRYFLVIC